MSDRADDAPRPPDISDGCPICGLPVKTVIMPAAVLGLYPDLRIEHPDGRECRARWSAGRWVMA